LLLGACELRQCYSAGCDVAMEFVRDAPKNMFIAT
jgi:hypothetical protein